MLRALLLSPRWTLCLSALLAVSSLVGLVPRCHMDRNWYLLHLAKAQLYTTLHTSGTHMSNRGLDS